jgi:hypothetical protein
VFEIQYMASIKLDISSSLIPVTKLEHSFFTWYIGLCIRNKNNEYKAIFEVKNSFASWEQRRIFGLLSAVILLQTIESNDFTAEKSYSSSRCGLFTGKRDTFW